jgi:hypothetical protein
MKWFGLVRRVAVEGEHCEALIAVVADPHSIGAEVQRLGESLQARRLGAFADDCDVRLQTQHRIELAMQRHAAIPRGQPHTRFPIA